MIKNLMTLSLYGKIHSPQMQFNDYNRALLQHPLLWQEGQHGPVENILVIKQTSYQSNW